MKLKSDKLVDYITNDFFENLSLNFSFYGVDFSGYSELLKLSTKKEYEEYFDMYRIRNIVDLIIEEILVNGPEYLSDFDVVKVVYNYYPDLLESDTMEELGYTFSDFYTNDCDSVIDWGGPEVIEEYCERLGELGDLFNVNVDETKECLMAKADEMEFIDEDFSYESLRESNYDYAFSDDMVLEMFEALLN